MGTRTEPEAESLASQALLITIFVTLCNLWLVFSGLSQKIAWLCRTSLLMPHFCCYGVKLMLNMMV